MPNRYVHSMYYDVYKQAIYDQAHPKEAQDRALGEGLSELL